MEVANVMNCEVFVNAMRLFVGETKESARNQN